MVAMEVGAAVGAPELTLEGIYRAQLSYIYASFLHLGVPPRDVEDLIHDLFVRVHASLERYDPSRPIRPWLFGIAFNLASNYFRSARVRREVMADLPEGPAEDVPVEDRLSAQERYRVLCRALDVLDLDRRAVFVMHEIDELPVPAIAETLGIPLNTAYSRLRLARGQVAAAARRILTERDEP